MEIVLALILALGTYEYIKKDDVDPTKHVVVSDSITTASYQSGSYYSNTIKKEGKVVWIISTN